MTEQNRIKRLKRSCNNKDHLRGWDNDRHFTPPIKDLKKAWSKKPSQQ